MAGVTLVAGLLLLWLTGMTALTMMRSKRPFSAPGEIAWIAGAGYLAGAFLLTLWMRLLSQVGVGFSPLHDDHRKLRVGLSENLFQTWNTTPPSTHTTRTVESAFLEAEFKLPWRMYLLERGAYYLPDFAGVDGWENRVELSKKFTETLSTSIRHDVRRYNPDGKTQDYTRLRLLFGVDF